VRRARAITSAGDALSGEGASAVDAPFGDDVEAAGPADVLAAVCPPLALMTTGVRAGLGAGVLLVVMTR